MYQAEEIMYLLQKQIHLLITFTIILVHICDTITFGIIYYFITQLSIINILFPGIASDASASNSNSNSLVSSDILVIALD